MGEPTFYERLEAVQAQGREVRRLALEQLSRPFRPLVVRLAWWLTTHDGFYSPCDDDHCIEVRTKARALGGGNPRPWWRARPAGGDTTDG